MTTVPDDHEAPCARREAPRESARAQLAALSPAYFGMVMATGVVSLGAHRLDVQWLANGLFGLNIAVYAVLWLLYLARLTLHARRFLGDMVDHVRGPGYFTLVAATSVLGSQFLLLAGDRRVGMMLWFVAAGLWVVLTYTIFAAFTIKARKPSLADGIGSGWLLAVVATQSVAVLAALLAVHIEQPGKLAMNFVALSMWLWGGMLYIWLMALIFYRYTFFGLSAQALAPPYWINMGAMAISTLAGSLLIVNVAGAPFLLSLQPFIKGFTLFYWATGTWWIPLLVILAVWRHVYERVPLRYDPLYWGAVFPLGMYAAGTGEMIAALEFPFLRTVPVVFFYAALAAWTAAFIGLVVDLLRRLAPMRAGT